MRWVAAFAVVGALGLAIGYTHMYAVPVYIEVDGRPMICWPKEMRHIWQRGGRHVFACVPVTRELSLPHVWQ